jgi:hypothetical protein
MRWLVGAFDEGGLRRTLRAYRYLLQSPELSATFQDNRKEYDLGDRVLSATPVQMTVDESSSSS